MSQVQILSPRPVFHENLLIRLPSPLREPNFDLFDLPAPLQCRLVRTVVEVDVVALDLTPAVFDHTVPVPRDINHRSERKDTGIGGNGAVAGLGAAGRDANGLGFTFIRTAGYDRPAHPVSLPAATFAAGTIRRGHDAV